MSHRVLACVPIMFIAACSPSGTKNEPTATPTPALPKLVLTGDEGYRNAIGCMVKAKALSAAYFDLANKEKVNSNEQNWYFQASQDKVNADSPYSELAIQIGVKTGRKYEDLQAEQKVQEDLVAKERNSRSLLAYAEWLEREFDRCPALPVAST